MLSAFKVKIKQDFCLRAENGSARFLFVSHHQPNMAAKSGKKRHQF